MAVQLHAVCTAIAGLTWPTLHVFTLEQLEDDVDERLCPVAQWMPQAGFHASGVADDSFGGPAGKKTQLWEVTYGIFQKPLNVGRGLKDVMPGLADSISEFETVLIANDFLSGVVAGVMDIRVSDITQSGPIADPAGNQYHGAIVKLTVKEFIN